MRPKIVLFGDSITEESFDIGGWGASLANHFSRTADVVLRGYSGYNTRWALLVAEKVFPASDITGGYVGAPPLAVTVFFGANDACLPDRCSAFQHVPLLEYQRNLHSIVSFFKATFHLAAGMKQMMLSYRNKGVVMLPGHNRWPKTIIILITPPPIDEDARLRYPYIENPTGLPERTNEAAGAYAKACVAVAEECGCAVVDLWTRMQEFSDWKNAHLRDGLHLSEEGNKLVFEDVVRKLREQGLGLEALPVDLPLINNIDPNDPLKAFEN